MVLIRSLVTFGIYALVWHVQAKDEVNRSIAADMPSAWWLLVPIAGPLHRMWKWCAGAEKATGVSGISAFLFFLVIPIVAIPVMVSNFNAAAARA